MSQKSKAAQSRIKNLGSKAQQKPSVTIKDVPDEKTPWPFAEERLTVHETDHDEMDMEIIGGDEADEVTFFLSIPFQVRTVPLWFLAALVELHLLWSPRTPKRTMLSSEEITKVRLIRTGKLGAMTLLDVLARVHSASKVQRNDSSPTVNAKGIHGKQGSRR
ncbi:hypothetical protein BU17DRAFT_83070 [Hysterangium stoloniferum]|nr:hypothetical protein BU17DRAFT_83070 [Hysterangium stoloniferum]